MDVYENMCACIGMNICVRLYVCAPKCMHVGVYGCVCVYVFASICVFLYMGVLECACICVSVYV